MKTVVNMFWQGPHIGPIQSACIRSFLRNDFKVTLHCYVTPQDVPAGTDLFDASKIMPAAELLANRRTGSVALGANRYRYKLIEAGMGLYADCDMYCLTGVDGLGDYVFGREDDFTVNSAILAYPPGSALSRGLLDATEDKHAIPEGIKRSSRLRLRVRKLLGMPKSVEDQSWGVWGPTLLTRLVDQLELSDRVAPSDMFYPVHPHNASLFHAQGLKLADLTTPRTRMVHLWRQLLSPAPPPEGSPLAEILSA